MIRAFQQGAAVALGIDHAYYPARVDEVAPEVQASLARDFRTS
jgi:hypothetical protein